MNGRVVLISVGVIILALCLWAVWQRPGISPKPPPSLNPEEKTALILKANQFLAKISQVCREQNLKQIGPGDFTVTPWTQQTSKEENASMAIPEATVEVGSKAYRFTFTEPDGRFFDYQSSEVIDNPASPLRQLVSLPEKPGWTPAKAIEVAGAFLKILNQWPEVRLGPPQAEFTHTSYKSRTEALRGYWLVCWPRIDDEGHPFYWDHVTISLPENYEPSGACVMLGTPYVQPQGKPLSQKEALTKAKEAAWWKDSEPYSVADKLIGARLYAARLVIVAPQKRHWWQIFLDTTNSRLAWECWFEPIHSEKLKGPWYDERYAVRIDAYTGAVIGGDAML